MPQIDWFWFKLNLIFLQIFKYVESRAISGINIIGDDILGLGRVTYFEALFSLASLTRMSEFHVGNSLA